MSNDTQSKISDQEAKAFVLSAIALSAGVFPIAFWYGVFETVFFEHLFYVWVASSVALAASMLVPPVDALPAFVSWRGRVVLILPTLWLLLEAATNSTASLTPFDDWLLLGLAVAVVVVTLPYLIYVVVLITVPDIERLSAPTLRCAIVGCALAAAVAGVTIGTNHRLFLTCYDFKVAGDNIPKDCHEARSYLSPIGWSNGGGGRQ